MLLQVLISAMDSAESANVIRLTGKLDCINLTLKPVTQRENIMKKLFFLILLITTAALFSPLSYADGGRHRDHHGGGHRGHGWEHHKHRHHHYARPQINYYYSQPEVRYYQQPPTRYYQQPRYSNDQRSHQGLAGGVIGSVFGYELGNGDPVATGLGAAAGSYLGNGAGQDYPRRW